MRKAITVFFIQQGSSQDLRVSDESAWYVVRHTYPDANSARHHCEIETKCSNRQEAATLAEIYNAPPEPLGALAEWSGIKYDTLYQAILAKRLKARRVGKTWMSTRRDVHEYKARVVLKPRK